MTIELVDHVGQKEIKEKQINFVVEPPDAVIEFKLPQLMKLDAQGTTVSAVCADTALMHYISWYAWDIGLTANLLDVIWQREADVSEVPYKPSEEELLDSWDRYLEEHWDELVAQYNGKYVAIWEDSVYDSDKDLAALAERVYTAIGYKPIFMPYIGDKERVYEFTSPT